MLPDRPASVDARHDVTVALLGWADREGRHSPELDEARRYAAQVPALRLAADSVVADTEQALRDLGVALLDRGADDLDPEWAALRDAATRDPETAAKVTRAALDAA